MFLIKLLKLQLNVFRSLPHTSAMIYKEYSGTDLLFMVLYIPLKASQAQLKVGPYSIFMKLALCEIGFCLMDPCMGALPDTSASAYRHWSHTEDRKTAEEKRQIKRNKTRKKPNNFKKKERTCKEE